MPIQTLLRTSSQDGYAVEINGRRLIDSHEEITAILSSRLGKNHAAFLASPVADPHGGIQWTTTVGGEVRRSRDLPNDEREKLERVAARIRGDISGLAALIKSEGPASEPLGRMLEQVAYVPPGDWLFSVGGKAVSAMWGVGAQSAPGKPAMPLTKASGGPVGQVFPDPTVARTTNGEGTSGKPDVVDVEARTVPIAPGLGQGGPNRPWWRWLLWALLAGLLLATLLFGLRRCAGDVAPVADPSGSLAEVERQNKELEDEIARRKNAPQFVCEPMPVKPAEPPSSDSQSPASEPEPAAATPPAPAPTPTPKQPPSIPQSPASVTPGPVPIPKTPASTPPRPEPRSESLPAPAPSAQAKCKPVAPGNEPEVVLIIDASGSMNKGFDPTGTRLDAAKRSAGAMVRGLPDGVDVGLVEFTACGQVRRDRFYPTPERGALINEINGLSPQKGTPLAEAIKRAGTVASSSADSVMVVVSDGDDSCGGDPCAAARAIRAARPNLTINVIDLADNARDKQVLQCIASAGGGRVMSPTDPMELGRKMKEAVAPITCKQ